MWSVTEFVGLGGVLRRLMQVEGDFLGRLELLRYCPWHAAVVCKKNGRAMSCPAMKVRLVRKLTPLGGRDGASTDRREPAGRSGRNRYI